MIELVMTSLGYLTYIAVGFLFLTYTLTIVVSVHKLCVAFFNLRMKKHWMINLIAAAISGSIFLWLSKVFSIF